MQMGQFKINNSLNQDQFLGHCYTPTKEKHLVMTSSSSTDSPKTLQQIQTKIPIADKNRDTTCVEGIAAFTFSGSWTPMRRGGNMGWDLKKGEFE